MNMSHVSQPPAEALDTRQPGRALEACAAHDNTSGRHVVMTASSLDHLPDLVLSRILSYTTDIKQKLRLALTCRRLYNIVSQGKAAWPARVYITHGCIYFLERTEITNLGDANAILVSVSDTVEGVERRHDSQARHLLPATNPERLLSVMNLPAVCPVPVGLRIMPCCSQGRQRYFLLNCVLPWLLRNKGDRRLLYSSVNLQFTHEEFEWCSQLLYVWRNTGVPVYLKLTANDRVAVEPEFGPVGVWASWRFDLATQQCNVQRLSLIGRKKNLTVLPRVVRLFPHATDVDLGEFAVAGQAFGWNWSHIWHEFVATRAQPWRPHTLQTSTGYTDYTWGLAAATGKLQSGRSVGVSHSLRRVLNDSLGPELLASIEEAAEVVAVTLPSFSYYTSGSRKTLVTLHLRMKHHRQADWTVQIYEVIL